MKIEAKQALEIKSRLWQGHSQSTIARLLGVSQGSVSRINLGNSWSDLPWQDGSFGPFPDSRRRELAGLEPLVETTINDISGTVPRLDESAIEAAADAAQEKDDACLVSMFKSPKSGK